MTAKKQTAIIFGATGLIGSELLNQLLVDNFYDQIIIFVRRKIELKHKKLKVEIVDIFNISAYNSKFKDADVYCCLGTTIKKAKSKEQFKKIDFELPVLIAKQAANNYAACFAFISSIGANSNSSNFYLNTKGQVEVELKKLEFNKLVILRPSLLLGKRKEKRFSEDISKVIMGVLNPFFIGGLKKYRGVQAKSVAIKMKELVQNGNNGFHLIESDNI